MRIRLAVTLLGLLLLGLVAGGRVAAAPPSAPAPLGPADGASVTVPFTISWSQVLDPAALNGGYNWEIGSAADFSLLAARDSTFPGVTQATVSGLANGTYFWRVQAVNGAVEVGPWSATRSFTVTGAGPGQPAAPALNPPHGGTTQFHPWEAIRFSWSAVAGAATYTTEFSTDSRFPVSSTSYIKNTNIPGTTDGMAFGDTLQGTWFMRVRAVNADRVAGAASNVISFSVLYANPVGPPPALISPTGNPTLTLPVTLSWTDGYNPQSSGYEVQVSSSSSFSTLENPVPGLTNPRIVYTDLSTGPKFWRVRSHQGMASPTTTAVTAWSATGTFTISSAPAAVASITLTVNPLYSGAEQRAEVQLTARAPAGGAVVSLTSSNPNALPVPATTTVDAGVAIGGLPILFAGQVTAPTPVTVTATYNGSSASTTITVMPPTLKADILQPVVRATGGAQMVGRLDLEGGGLAGPGGVAVSLTSSSPAANPPATVTIPQGANSTAFAIPTSAVTTSTIVTISASHGGVTSQWQITLTPSPPPDALTLQPVSTTSGSQGIVRIPLSAITGYDQLLRVTSSSPIASVPEFVTVPASIDIGRFDIATSPVLVPTVVTISVTGGGVTRSADLTVSPSLPTLTALLVSPTSVAGGTPATGTVTLGSAAPTGGVAVNLGSNLPGSAGVPATVTVPAGATSATFTVTTFPVDATTVQLSATLGSVTQFASLGITRAAALTALTLSPSTVLGGSSSTGTVTLGAAAPSGGTVVTLSDDSAAATVPASVTVAAGATSANFIVTTSAVTSATPVTVSGSSGGTSQSATLTVNPPAPAAPSLLSPAADATPAQPVAFDWSDVANGAAYEIQVDDSSTIAAPFRANQIVSVSQASIGGLPAQRLWWRVRARNSAGVFGPFSSTRRFTPQVATSSTPSLSSLAVSPASVLGGASSIGTITLTAAAPSGGAVVTLTSANAAVASAPASVTVAAGATSATFTVATSAVTAQTAVTLTAAWSGVSRTTTLTVNAPASLNSVSLVPASLTGGSSSQGTVTLTSAAPAGGLVVTLSDNSTAATVPASVTVAAGATSAGFTVTTSAVSAQTAVTITATAGGVSRAATLTLNPASSGTLAAPSLVSPAADASFSPGQTITFDWSDVTGAASYTIQIDDQDTFSSPNANQTVTASTYATSTLPTTRMWWRVRANDAFGTPGAWSAARRFEIK